MIAAGTSGQPPAAHPILRLAPGAEAATPDDLAKLALAPTLRRERKVLTIAGAAAAALRGYAGDRAALAGCGLVLATRWDGRLPLMLHEGTARLRSCRDLPPSTIALSLVPHVSAGLVAALLGLGSPSLSVGTGDPLGPALELAAVCLGSGSELMLLEDFELGAPAVLAGEDADVPTDDYAVACLLARPHRARDAIAEVVL